VAYDCDCRLVREAHRKAAEHTLAQNEFVVARTEAGEHESEDEQSAERIQDNLWVFVSDVL